MSCRSFALGERTSMKKTIPKLLTLVCLPSSLAAIPLCWTASSVTTERSWQGCICSVRSIANPIPANRISPVACWCCHQTRCGNPAGSRRTSCGWPSAASAAAPMPVAARCSAPVWATARQRDGIALSSWASFAMSVSLIGRQRSWPSCGRTRTRSPWAK